ncbi:MAG: enolase C-terminal domain-like protein, partial [Gaiellaceae bacterium]
MFPTRLEGDTIMRARSDVRSMPQLMHEYPTIRSVSARPVVVPMDPPHRTASGAVTDSPLVLVEIESSDGVTGNAIVFTYTRAALKPCAELITNLAALVVGDPLAPLEIEAKLSSRCRLLGTQGLVGMAIAGIDMAAWDALARGLDQPLALLLGGDTKPIRAYGAVGYDGPEDSAAAAASWAERGFGGVKAKIGYPTVDEDIEVIRAMRAAVGDDVVIMVDYNQSLTPVEASHRLAALETEKIAWVEEPVLAHDFAGHASVARQARVPIQCGENWWGVLDLEHAIDAGASDYVMADVMKIGGVTGWQ